MSPRSLTYVSIITSAILLVASALVGDWFWFIVLVTNELYLIVPLVRNADFYYGQKLIWATIIPAVLQLILVTLELTVHPFGDMEWLQVPVYHYFSALFQSMMAFAGGLVFMVWMDRAGVLVITKRWMILFAMMYSLMVSVISLFFTFVYLYETGVPVFNGAIAETGHRESNNLMMTSALVTTFASPFYALFVVKITKGRGKDAFTIRREAE